MARSFLWGSTPDKRKLHLLSWDKVCRPKAEGGLGIRKSMDMNKALVAKVGWRLMQDRTSLWARVLRSKYKAGDFKDRRWLVAKRPGSSTWRSVIGGLKNVVTKGNRWVIGDGKEVSFWTDSWFTQETLIERAVAELLLGYKELRVKDFWQDERGWRFDQIMPFVPQGIRLELAAVVIDNVTGARDRLAWGGTADGKFTVKSAHTFLTRDEAPRPNMMTFFKILWRVCAPERIRCFLWMVGSQIIMTNGERFRRHLSDTNLCQVCNRGEEIILHVLRDCPSIAGVWRRIVQAKRRQGFRAATVFEWLYGNLQGTGSDAELIWPTLFSIVVWWSWKLTCGYVFGEVGKCRDRVSFVKGLASEVWRADQLTRNGAQLGLRTEQLIAWKPPRREWLRLNTDGASRGNPGLATAGGALRDGLGRWCGGFSINIGFCSAPLAELWGVYYGLYMAWEKRLMRIELEVHSELVVGFLR